MMKKVFMFITIKIWKNLNMFKNVQQQKNKHQKEYLLNIEKNREKPILSILPTPEKAFIKPIDIKDYQ